MSRSHTRMVLSSELETTRPSNTATALTLPWWPSRTRDAAGGCCSGRRRRGNEGRGAGQLIVSNTSGAADITWLCIKVTNASG